VAKEQGIADNEIGAVQSIVMAMSGCNIRNKVQSGEILPNDHKKRFSDFYDTARHNDILKRKTTFMIQTAAALAIGCQT
jgi:hypothetical protein